MSAYGRYLPKFAEHDAQVVGISPDSIYSHLAWQEKSIGWLEYPLLSDYWPHAGVAQQFGILRLGEPLPGINDGPSSSWTNKGRSYFPRPMNLARNRITKNWCRTGKVQIRERHDTITIEKKTPSRERAFFTFQLDQRPYFLAVFFAGAFLAAGFLAAGAAGAFCSMSSIIWSSLVRSSTSTAGVAAPPLPTTKMVGVCCRPICVPNWRSARILVLNCPSGSSTNGIAESYCLANLSAHCRRFCLSICGWF